MTLLSISVLRLKLFDPVLIYFDKLRQFSIQNHISLLFILQHFSVTILFIPTFFNILILVQKVLTNIFLFRILVDDGSE